MTNEYILLAIIVGIIIWWLIDTYRFRQIIGVIHWKNGTVTKTDVIFHNFAQFESWVKCRLKDKEIDYISYENIEG